MKASKILFIIFLLSISYATLAQDFKADIDQVKVKFLKIKAMTIKVKSEEEWLKKYQDTIFYYCEFDKTGNLLKQKRFDLFKDVCPINFLQVNEYDKKGNLIEDKFILYHYRSLNPQLLDIDTTSISYRIEKKKNIYNSHNQQVKAHIYESEEMTKIDGEVEYIYNSQGKLIKEVSTRLNKESSVSQYIMSYEFDNKNNLSKELHLSLSLKDTLETKNYKYNVQNKQVELLTKNTYSSMRGVSKEINLYDKQGDMIEQKFFEIKKGVEKLITRVVSVYDVRHNLISKTTFHLEDKSEFYISYTYNEQNLLMKEIFYKGDKNSQIGAVFETSYEFYE